MRYVKWIVVVLVISLVLVIGGVVWEKEKEKYVNRYETQARYKYISIKVITKCLGDLIATSYRYCVVDEQKIIFENLKENIKKEISNSSPKVPLNYYQTELDEQVIRYFGPSKSVFEYPMFNVSFYENKNGEIFIEIHYFRGGNCAQCFYNELYNDHGKLIATDKQRIYLYSKTEKFSHLVKQYEKVKQKLGFYSVNKEIDLWEEILRKGGKL